MIKPDEKLYQWLRDNAVIEPLSKIKIRTNASGKRIVSKGLSEAGYDLTLNHSLMKFSLENYSFRERVANFFGIKKIVIDPHNNGRGWREVATQNDYYDMPPKSFLLASSTELITMPLDYIAICFGKSTYARNGIFLPMTPLEPGWRGYVTLEIANLTQNYNRLWLNEGICQILFLPLESPASAYSGAYQNQTSKPQVSIC